MAPNFGDLWTSGDLARLETSGGFWRYLAAVGTCDRYGAVLPSVKSDILANTADWQTLLAHTFELIVNRALIACPEDRNLNLDDTSRAVFVLHLRVFSSAV